MKTDILAKGASFFRGCWERYFEFADSLDRRAKMARDQGRMVAFVLWTMAAYIVLLPFLIFLLTVGSLAAAHLPQ